jgi:hypothetical protein
MRMNSVHPGPTDTDMIAFRTPERGVVLPLGGVIRKLGDAATWIAGWR